MCAATHGWAGLGRIVYATSSQQLGGWLADLGVSPAPVLPLAITQVIPGLVVAGQAAGTDALLGSADEHGGDAQALQRAHGGQLREVSGNLARGSGDGQHHQRGPRS
jgi:hypothetical protein